MPYGMPGSRVRQEPPGGAAPALRWPGGRGPVPSAAPPGALTAGAMGDAGWRALRLALSSAVGTMIQSQA